MARDAPCREPALMGCCASPAATRVCCKVRSCQPACVFSASASRVRGLKADRLLSATLGPPPSQRRVCRLPKNGTLQPPSSGSRPGARSSCHFRSRCHASVNVDACVRFAVAKLRVGYIGVGLMGHGAAKNILTHGHPLIVMGHRNREPVDDLVAPRRARGEDALPASLPRATSSLPAFRPRSRSRRRCSDVTACSRRCDRG